MSAFGFAFVCELICNFVVGVEHIEMFCLYAAQTLRD
jgi:hypothetical protein